jgi:beta-lactamase superfamily II metal-dependent hydrolase
MKPRVLVPLAVLFAVVTSYADDRVGEPLSAWTRGTLDIHQIATGRGNSSLLILPDGTTLLVDAGAAPDGLPETDPHPDGSRTPGAWIARYIMRHLPAELPGLDYAVITHFHADHMGQVTKTSALGPTGLFKLTGITEVGNTIPIRTLIDRGWPDYSYPVKFSDETMANYRHFLDAKISKGMQVERFKPGASTQIVLKRHATSYPTFEIRNIIANGEMWTGFGGATRALFPPTDTLPVVDRPNENMCSLGFRLTYGNFRYFTGGDLPGTPDPGFPSWHAPEGAIAAVIGPVDVHVVNMHGSMGEESEAFHAKLQSTVLIIPSWAPSHPAPDVLKRIMNSRLPPVQRYVFATDLREAARIVIGQRASQLAGPPGHIVVRIEAGGNQYRVFTLENHDERDLITSVRGPLAAAQAALR